MNRLLTLFGALLAFGALAFSSDGTGQGGPGGGQPPPDVRVGDHFNNGWRCVAINQDHHGQWNAGFATPEGGSWAQDVTTNTAGTAVVSSNPWRAPDGTPTRIKGGRLQQYNQGHGRWMNVTEVPPPSSPLMPDNDGHWFDGVFGGDTDDDEVVGPGDDIGGLPETDPPKPDPELSTYWPNF